jgi:hypothetical protein
VNALNWLAGQIGEAVREFRTELNRPPVTLREERTELSCTSAQIERADDPGGGIQLYRVGFVK